MEEKQKPAGIQDTAGARKTGLQPLVDGTDRALRAKLEAARGELVREIARRQDDRYALSKPMVGKLLVDEEKRIGAFTVARQIDIDGGWPWGDAMDHGERRHQIKVSVFVVSEDGKSREIFERNRYTISPQVFAGSMALVRLEKDGVVAKVPRIDSGAFGLSELVKISFEGKICEVEDFMTRAKNAVVRAAPKLGYDFLDQITKIADGVAIAVFSTENGRDYGYTTVYAIIQAGSELKVMPLRQVKDVVRASGEIVDKDLVVRFEGTEIKVKL